MLDACAGLGHDSLILLFAGARVTACERHAQVHAALAAELARLRAVEPFAEPLSRLELVAADARTLMAQRRFDVIYLDPMYPAARRKAAPAAELALLAELVGADADADALLAPARAAARHRVVVKRPRRAPPLAGVASHRSLRGSSLRFDLYLPDVRP